MRFRGSFLKIGQSPSFASLQKQSKCHERSEIYGAKCKRCITKVTLKLLNVICVEWGNSLIWPCLIICIAFLELILYPNIKTLYLTSRNQNFRTFQAPLWRLVWSVNIDEISVINVMNYFILDRYMKIHEKTVHLHFLVMSNSWAGWAFWISWQSNEQKACQKLSASHHIPHSARDLSTSQTHQPEASCLQVRVHAPGAYTSPLLPQLLRSENWAPRTTSQTVSARGYLSATLSQCSESSSTTRTWLAELISPTHQPLRTLRNQPLQCSSSTKV